MNKLWKYNRNLLLVAFLIGVIINSVLYTTVWGEVGSISVITTKTQLMRGEIAQLTVTGILTNGSFVDLTAETTGTTYLPSDPALVNVGSSGEVTAINNGKVNILVINQDQAQSPPAFISAEITLLIGDPIDLDGDGVPNEFEITNGLDPLNAEDALQDSDGDGLPNRAEFELGTNLRERDTDGDGLPDGDELGAGLDPLIKDFVPPPRLDENCIATLLNRNIQVNEDGSFLLENIPVPSGLFRLRIVCEHNNKIERGASPFTEGVPDGITQLGEITFEDESPIPVSLNITFPASILTPTVIVSQLVTTGTLSDGASVDLSLAETGTSYRSSNPGIATVSPNGLITGLSSGRVFITATNQGAIGSVQIDVQFSNDSDGDGIPNDFEIANSPTLDPNNPNDAGQDFDGDHLTNLEEFNLGTSLFLADTDGDGLNDDQEVAIGSNPLVGDSDNDGLLDGNESNPTADLDGDGLINILDPDSDNDGLPDGVEVALVGNPFSADPTADDDGDQLTNLDEVALFTDPNDFDTDNDGLGDGEEVLKNTNPLIPDATPPVVILTSPPGGTQVLEGELLTLSATATDDGRVVRVDFLVNNNVVGSDTVSPYSLNFAAPVGIGGLTVQARAVDTNNNLGTSSEVFVTVTPDPLTTVIGVVLDTEGLPAAGATVTTTGNLATVTLANGSFSIPNVPTAGGTVVASASLLSPDNKVLRGRSAVTSAVRGGTTDVGTIMVGDLPAFETDLGTNLNQTDDDFDFVAFTDGFTFPFFGVTYTGVFVNSNGRLTFGFGDTTFSENLVELNEQPQIAAFFDDLHPMVFVSPDTGVFVKQFPDRFVVTYNMVPEFGGSVPNTVQIILFQDGNIQLGYNGVSAQDAIVGISPGASPSLIESDLSAQASFSTDSQVAIFEQFLEGGDSGEGEVDHFAFTGLAGDSVSAEILASRNGSALDSLLTLLDSNGVGLAQNDDFSGLDSRIDFTLPGDGTYFLQVRDLGNRGGPDFFYTLTVEGPLNGSTTIPEVEPNDALSSATPFEFGGTDIIQGVIQRTSTSNEAFDLDKNFILFTPNFNNGFDVQVIPFPQP